MADKTITAANVKLKSSTTRCLMAQYGDAITQGQALDVGQCIRRCRLRDLLRTARIEREHERTGGRPADGTVELLGHPSRVRRVEPVQAVGMTMIGSVVGEPDGDPPACSTVTAMTSPACMGTSSRAVAFPPSASKTPAAIGWSPRTNQSS